MASSKPAPTSKTKKSSKSSETLKTADVKVKVTKAKKTVEMPSTEEKKNKVEELATKTVTAKSVTANTTATKSKLTLKDKGGAKGTVSVKDAASNSDGVVATAKKVIIQRLDLYLDYEHRGLPSQSIPASELPKLSLLQAQRLKALAENPLFKEILTLTPSAVNLPVPGEYLTNEKKITDEIKSVLIDFLRAQDEILIHAIHIYEAGNISVKTAESLKKYRILKRKNTSRLYNAGVSWGEYNQQINRDLEAVKTA